jgi:hypothetical protein
VDIDKEKGDMISLEIKQLKTQVERDKQMQQKLLGIFNSRSGVITDLKKKLPTGEKYLSAQNLKNLGGDSLQQMEADAMTEFSVLTTESEILPTENVLDLRISEVQYEKMPINGIFGLQEILPNAIKTFMTFDFFNNETMNTELKTGYDPQFDTIFCFKNTVDDFYLNYLSKNHIIAELFAVMD